VNIRMRNVDEGVATDVCLSGDRKPLGSINREAKYTFVGIALEGDLCDRRRQIASGMRRGCHMWGVLKERRDYKKRKQGAREEEMGQ